MKKIKLTIVLVVFTWVSLYSQEKKWSYGLSVSPSYSFGIVSSDDSEKQGVVEFHQEREFPKFSYSGSVFLEYKLNVKSRIGVELGFHNNGIRGKKQVLYTIGGSGFVFDPNGISDIRINHTSYHIEIPLYFKYYFYKKLYAKTGFSGLFNIENKTTSIKYYHNGNKTTETVKDNSADFRKVNVYGNFGLGIDYLTREKFSLFVNPYVQYGLMTVTKDAVINRTMMMLGISTGIRF